MSKAASVRETLGLNGDNRKVHPWQFPNCPACDRHIYVDKYNYPHFAFRCYKCGPFNVNKSDLREELRQ